VIHSRAPITANPTRRNPVPAGSKSMSLGRNERGCEYVQLFFVHAFFRSEAPLTRLASESVLVEVYIYVRLRGVQLPGVIYTRPVSTADNRAFASLRCIVTK
jgi:hypothetical protein